MKPSKVPAPKLPEHSIIHGDEIYFSHPEHGPLCGPVCAIGKDGCQVEHELAGDARYLPVTWDRIHGHKARKERAFTLIDQGEDGAIAQDENGRRVYIHGDIPDDENAPEIALKSWWGPSHGGTHVKRANHDNAGDGLPPSGNIQTAAEANDYWRQNLAGKTLSLTVKVKAGQFPLAIHFDESNTHMWTRAAKNGETPDAYDRPMSRQGPRVYDHERAGFMEHIVPAMRHPWKVLGSHDRNLFLGAPVSDGRTYVVVLRVIKKGVCDFVTAQPRDKTGIKKLTDALRPVLPGGHSAHKQKPLRKAASDPLVLNVASGVSRFRDSQVASTLTDIDMSHCRASRAPARADVSMRYAIAFFKALDHEPQLLNSLHQTTIMTQPIPLLFLKARPTINPPAPQEPEPPREEENPEPQTKRPVLKHGYRVRFKAGEHEGEGSITAIGDDGVTVQDDEGREHGIHHHELTHYKRCKPSKTS